MDIYKQQTQIINEKSHMQQKLEHCYPLHRQQEQMINLYTFNLQPQAKL